MDLVIKILLLEFLLKVFLFFFLMCVTVQANVVENNKQLILEGQLHVALQTIGKETTSPTPREVHYAYQCFPHTK